MMSASEGTSASVFLFSVAHICLALSIWRKLLMQALRCAVLRALEKLGMAIAANRPMMATTIMISTSVKPDRERWIIFMLLSGCSPGQSRYEYNNKCVGYAPTRIPDLFA